MNMPRNGKWGWLRLIRACRVDGRGGPGSGVSSPCQFYGFVSPKRVSEMTEYAGVSGLTLFNLEMRQS
jgi:hypothetical protein